ncbi:MAG: NAD(P)-binding protein, partial [Chloroflexi bacterium]|nr:NAD(P)-binding protein [Chloroflexota bacterium]
MSAAWHLHEYGFDVKVFERSGRVGGDVQTIDVMIGGEKRWVDLGVNDFNAKTYKHLATMFDKLGVRYRRLEDTECFYTLDGSFLYTSDGRWGTAPPEAIKRDVARFRRDAPEVLSNSAYRHVLIKEYVNEQ